jgi:flagellar hook-associated protein 3 FlgL
MRITSGMMMATTLRNIEINQQRTEQLQSQISSGNQITKPSDNPIGTAQAMDLQHTLDAAKQYDTNIDNASSWLNTADSALNGVTQAIERANELAVQAANGTLSASDLQAVQAEVTQLQAHVLDITHTQYGNSYVFSGTRTNVPGYTTAADSSVTPGAYAGNTVPVQREVGPGVSISVNADAQATFNPVFSALAQLATGLQNNNSSTIQSSIALLGGALDSVNLSRADLGAKLNRIQLLQQQQQTSELGLTSQLSNVKDTDMAQAITDFSMANATYQASLKAAAQALQPSLLDYIK